MQWVGICLSAFPSVCLCVPAESLLISLDLQEVSSSDLLARVHHKYYGTTDRRPRLLFNIVLRPLRHPDYQLSLSYTG